MTKKSLAALRAHLDSFEPEFPMKKGYIAKMLLGLRNENRQILPSREIMHSKLMNLMQYLQPSKCFDDESIKLSVKRFDMIFIKKCKNLADEWSSLMDLFNEIFHLKTATFPSNALRKLIKVSPPSVLAVANDRPSSVSVLIAAAVAIDRLPSTSLIASAVATDREPSTSFKTMLLSTAIPSASTPYSTVAAVTTEKPQLSTPSLAAAATEQPPLSPLSSTPPGITTDASALKNNTDYCTDEQHPETSPTEINSDTIKILSAQRKHNGDLTNYSAMEVNRTIKRKNDSILLWKEKYRNVVEISQTLNSRKELIDVLTQENKEMAEQLRQSKNLTEVLQKELRKSKVENKKLLKTIVKKKERRQLLDKQLQATREAQARIDELEDKVHLLAEALAVQRK